MAKSFARSSIDSPAIAPASISKVKSEPVVQAIVQASVAASVSPLVSSLTELVGCVRNAEVEGSTPFRSTFV